MNGEHACTDTTAHANMQFIEGVLSGIFFPHGLLNSVNFLLLQQTVSRFLV